MSAFWACLLSEANREKVAVKFLNMAGYEVYCPFLSTKRGVAPLFPGGSVLAGSRPSAVGGGHAGVSPFAISWERMASRRTCRIVIIEELRKREVRGSIKLPEAPRFRPGDKVRITEGPLADRLAIFARDEATPTRRGAAAAARELAAGRALPTRYRTDTQRLTPRQDTSGTPAAKNQLSH